MSRAGRRRAAPSAFSPAPSVAPDWPLFPDWPPGSSPGKSGHKGWFFFSQDSGARKLCTTRGRHVQSRGSGTHAAGRIAPVWPRPPLESLGRRRGRSRGRDMQRLQPPPPLFQTHVLAEALRPALPRVGRLISKASGILSPMTQDKKDVRQPWAEKRSLLPHSLMPNCSFFQQIRPRTPRATFFRAPVNTSSSVLAS